MLTCVMIGGYLWLTGIPLMEEQAKFFEDAHIQVMHIRTVRRGITEETTLLDFNDGGSLIVQMKPFAVMNVIDDCPEYGE